MRLTLLIALFLGGLFNCGGPEVERYSWNQRMTVTVDTPDGPVSGSTVYEMTAHIFPEGGGLAGDTAANYRFRGEVAVIDLGEDRYIFAYPLASGDVLYGSWIERYPEISIFDRSDWLPSAIEDPTPLELNESLHPRLVTFEDISDPLTANIFEANEMEAIFGEGYAISSVKVQVVDDPIVSGRVIELLPWLTIIRPNRLDGNRFQSALSEYPDASELSANFFSTEIGIEAPR
jgi:hypothetical protein